MTDLKKIVYIDYKAYLADASNKLYDTTNADAAKEAGIFNEKYVYAPMAHIVGSKTLFPDIEDAISKAEVGKETKVTIPCEKAAGFRNPKLVELYPVKEFHKQEINPYPGLNVSLGNRAGVVISVGAGRVKVDFNNQLAGHDIMYIFTITKEVIDPNEKIEAILKIDFGSSEGFNFIVDDSKIVIIESETCKFNQSWTTSKYRIVSDVRDVFGINRVEFLQIWDSTKKK